MSSVSTINIPLTLARKLSHCQPGGFWESGNPIEELKILLEAEREKVTNDYVPFEGSFRVEETEKGFTYWLKAGGYNSSLYDFCFENEDLDFFGLKWEWNGDLKVEFRYNSSYQEKISKKTRMEDSQGSTILGGMVPLSKVFHEFYR